MVTRLKVIYNNSTHLTILPYFSAEQLSRIINSINVVIKDDTSLPVVLNKM